MHGGGGMQAGGGFHGGGGFRGGVTSFRGNAGFRGNTGFRNNFAFRGTRFFGFSPFLYSGFYGGYGYFDSYPYSGYPYYDSSYSGDPYAGGYSSGVPGVIINQAYAPPPPPPAPVVREYTGPTTQSQQPGAQSQSNEPPLYLIAFQDGVIRAALAYWVDGATLHYVSLDHEQKQAPVASVDRGLSGRLNGERNVDFRLPH